MSKLKQAAMENGFLPEDYVRPLTNKEQKREERLERWSAKVEDQHYKWGEPQENGKNPSRFLT